MPPQTTQPCQRTACNRCRLQKVRCPRNDQAQPGEPCARCVRAHAICVTNRARRVGRPRLAPLLNVEAAKQKESSEWLAEGSQNSTTSTSTPAVDSLPPDGLVAWNQDGQQVASLEPLGHDLIRYGDDSAPLPDWTFFGEDEGPATSTSGADFPTTTTTAPNVDNSSATVSLDDQYLNLFDYAGTLKETQLFLGETSTVQDAQESTSSLDQVVDVYRADTDDNGRGHRQRGYRSSSQARVNGSRDTSCVPSPERRHTEASSMFAPNILIELTRLSEGIAQQMIRLPRFFTQGVPVNTACAKELSSSRENPVSMLLQSTNDFIAILRRLGSASLSASSVPFRPQTSVTVPPPSTPIVLLVLSNYLQLLELYDTVFSHVVYTLYTINDLAGFFHDAPDYAIPGLPPVRGDLFVKIVIGIIEDRLAAAERLIGLPIDLRLANPQALRMRQHDISNDSDQGGHDVTGLLRQVPDSARLLQAIMTPAQTPTTAGLHGGEKSGKMLVTSLRGHLDIVWTAVSVGSA